VNGRGVLPLPPCAGPIVDAVCDVMEPEAAWDALPDRYRPRTSTDRAGAERVVVGDTELLAVPSSNAQPGGSDPVTRLRDMDSGSIDQAVLYPTIGLHFSLLADPAAAVALAAASNEWLAGYCAADPRRLFGTAMLPLQDPPAAARELRRAVGEFGLVAGFVRPDSRLGRPLSDRAYDVVWEVAQELAVPIAIHQGGSDVPTVGSDRPLNPLIRHPALRLLFLESSGGWEPLRLKRLDEQCAISIGVDEPALPALVPLVGQSRIVWGGGHPHHDATFHGALAALRSTVAPCRTATQVHVLGLNARRLYGLRSRRDGLPGLLDDYFTAVTAQEIDLVRALFADDAVFESGDIRLQGLDAICGYYLSKTFTYEDFRPAPGKTTFEGTRMEVDIDVHLGGANNSVHDVFETDGRRITALRVSGFEEALRSTALR
jgi:predicted TIM-barrel fold metal-dependent hydrolase